MPDVPMRPLDDLVFQVREKTSGAKDPNLPYVGLEHITSSGSTLLSCGSSEDSISTNGLFRAGDTLFGKLRPRLRKAVSVSFDGYCSTDILVLRAKDGTHPPFVSFVLRSNAVFGEAIRTEEGTKMPRCSWQSLKKLEVFCPEIQEQEDIARVLAKADEAIEQTETLIAKMQQVKAGVMHDLFTRGLSPDGSLRPSRSEAPHLYKESAPGWVPVEWDCQLLDGIAERGSGHTPNKSRAEYWNGGIKWISLADSWRLDRLYVSDTDKTISAEGIANSSAVLHPAGVVVLSRDAGVGKSAITTEPMAVSQHFMCWRGGPDLDAHYLYYWLQREKHRFEAIATGTTIPTIGLGFFKKYRINVPMDINEQRRIGRVCAALDSQIFALENERSKLTQLKAGLMADLLTGHVPVVAPSTAL
jgi:type I restriction enzyme, S subunit